MNWFRDGLFSLGILTLLSGPTAIAETLFSTSSSPLSHVDIAVAAVLEVEEAGLDRVSQRQLASLSVAPEPDTQKLVGYTKARLATLPVAKGGKQWDCLTQALYFEARGESVLGQFAVAEVILNRVKSASYPDSICGVVKQGTGQRHRCQFSFYCDGRAEVINEPKAFEQVGKVSRLVLDGTSAQLTDGATHYHTKNVSPNWSRVFPRTATIGFHHFYRQPVRVVRR